MLIWLQFSKAINCTTFRIMGSVMMMSKSNLIEKERHK